MREIGLLLAKDLRVKSASGDKTQTRRIAKLPKYHPDVNDGEEEMTWFLGTKPNSYDSNDFAFFDLAWPIETYPTLATAQYQVGDNLYLQEPYQVMNYSFSYHTITGDYADGGSFYEQELRNTEWDRWRDRAHPLRKTSSRFMYKSLARHWFEVTDVRAERLRDISEADAIAEGVCRTGPDVHRDWIAGFDQGFTPRATAREAFFDLWDSCNKIKAKQNPWVFVSKYKKVGKQDEN